MVYKKSKAKFQSLRFLILCFAILVVVFFAILNTTVQGKTLSFLNDTYSNMASLIENGHTVPNIGTYGPVAQSYGIASGGGLTALSPAQLSKLFDDMQDTGVKWIRFDFDWSDIQYSNSKDYNWAPYDRLVDEANSHHMQVLGIIDYTPPWARISGCDKGEQCAPQDSAQFEIFAGKVAARYAGEGVHYWEIWNEPNDADFWGPKANCDAYTLLLKAAYPAIKKADPYATVITGGLSPESNDGTNISQTTFLSCIYKDGGEAYFDDVADHPYTFPQLASFNKKGAWAVMASTSPSLRSIMVANGDANKKIWITEFGAPTNGPGQAANNGKSNNLVNIWHVDEQLQAQTLTDAFTMYKTYNWVGPLFWYSYKDAGTATTTNENFFGLIRFDYSRKPAYDAFLNVLSGTNS